MAVDLSVLATNDGIGISVSGFSDLSALFGETLLTPQRIIENQDGSSLGMLQMELAPMDKADREIFRRAIVLNDGEPEGRRDEIVVALADGTDYVIWNVTFYANGALLCYHPQGDVDTTDQVKVSSANIPSVVLRFKIICRHFDSDKVLTLDYQTSLTDTQGSYSLSVIRDDEIEPVTTLRQTIHYDD